MRTILIATLAAFSPLVAQWINYPTPGLPRLANGKANLDAPAPRAAGGKPDLQGVWRSEGALLLLNLAGGGVQVPFQPWAEELYKKHVSDHGLEDPEAQCLPQGTPKMNTLPWPFKIINAPGLTVILYETNNLFRQIHTDGRPLPQDPNPTWLGYSIGSWEGDIFRVDTNGLSERMWLDTNGHPHTEALHIIERFRRIDFGHMVIDITIDDPKAYTRPWTVALRTRLLADTDLLEFICNENNNPSAKHMQK